MSSDSYATWFGAIAAVLGLWIVATPFLWSVPESFLWSNVIAGLIIATLGAYVAWRASGGERAHVGLPALGAISALWTLVSPFVFGDVAELAVYGNVVAGLIAFVLVGYTGYAWMYDDATPRGRTSV